MQTGGVWFRVREGVQGLVVADAAGTGGRLLSRAAVEHKARTVAPGAGTERVIALLDTLETLRDVRDIVPG